MQQMRILRISVTRFRCLADVSMDYRKLTAIVGRNGAGKSTFLQALNLFFDRTASVGDEDFYGGDRSADITIRITFGDLRTEELAELKPYVDGHEFTVTKRFPSGTPGQIAQGRYFAAVKSYEPFRVVRAAATAGDKVLAYGKLIDDGILPRETLKPKTGKQADEFMASYEAEHPELLTPVEQETQLFGEKNVGSGKVEKYTRFVYVPAVRDVMDEATDRKAAFAQLIDLVVMQKIAARTEVVELPARIREAVAAAYDETVVKDDLETLAADLNKTLGPFVQNAELSFKLVPPSVQIPEPRVIPRVTEDSYMGELGRKGHGLQRAVLFTVLSHFARVRGALSAAEGAIRPDIILAIEEPELYQHPARCRHIAGVLRDLSTTTGAGAPNTQIILTTHSPYFLAMERFEDITIVRKKSVDTGLAAESAVYARTLEDVRKKWVHCCGKDDEDVTLASLVARLRRPFLMGASEGFFADAVVLVEGAGDASLLERLAEKLGAEWHAQSVSVVSVDGKPNVGLRS